MKNIRQYYSVIPICGFRKSIANYKERRKKLMEYKYSAFYKSEVLAFKSKLLEKPTALKKYF